MIDSYQLRRLIEETLTELEQLGGPKYSDEARELLMLTAAHESHMGTYLEQKEGPALGIFQMEPATFRDIEDNYLFYRDELRKHVDWFFVFPEDPQELVWNLKAAIVMARIHYLRVAERIPLGTEDQAAYAKKYWNTEAGKATAKDYHEAYILRGIN